MNRDTEADKVNKMPFDYAHTRKACYQYSWDWAPKMKSQGIWKDVYLLSYDEARIDYVWVRNRLISQEKAIVNLAIALVADKEVLSNQALTLKV